MMAIIMYLLFFVVFASGQNSTGISLCDDTFWRYTNRYPLQYDDTNSCNTVVEGLISNPTIELRIEHSGILESIDDIASLLISVDENTIVSTSNNSIDITFLGDDGDSLSSYLSFVNDSNHINRKMGKSVQVYVNLSEYTCMEESISIFEEMIQRPLLDVFVILSTLFVLLIFIYKCCSCWKVRRYKSELGPGPSFKRNLFEDSYINKN